MIKKLFKNYIIGCLMLYPISIIVYLIYNNINDKKLSFNQVAFISFLSILLDLLWIACVVYFINKIKECINNNKENNKTYCEEDYKKCYKEMLRRNMYKHEDSMTYYWVGDIFAPYCNGLDCKKCEKCKYHKRNFKKP